MKKIYFVSFIILLFSKILICQDSCFLIDTFKVEPLQIEKVWNIDTFAAVKCPIIIDFNNNNTVDFIDYNKIGIESKMYLQQYKDPNKYAVASPEWFRGHPFPFTAADVDGDGSIEFLKQCEGIFNGENINYKLVCFNADLSIRWVSDFTPPYSNNPSPGLADFNQDGIPEVYINNAIFNAQTGKKLVENIDHARGDDISMMAVGQLDSDTSDLELAVGYTVFKVNISNPNGMTGNTMTPINLAINGKNIDGHTALADVNNDGQTDVIVAYGDNLTISLVYAYTIENNKAKLLSSFNIPSSRGGMGIPTIGMINDKLSLLVVGYNKLHSLVFDGSGQISQDWELTVNETSRAGATIFDLNGDGISEIIFRDEKNLRIINIINGQPEETFTFPCRSTTFYESPIVAALDSTGEAKICVTCEQPNNPIVYELAIFGSPAGGPAWAPARNVWHQHGYNPLYINDDLTIPQYLENPATYQNSRYNNYRVQGSLLDENGLYKRKAASLYGSIDCIQKNALDGTYTITYTLFNKAEASLTIADSISISFFKEEPTLGNPAAHIAIEKVTLNAGGQQTFTANLPSDSYGQLFMLVNNAKQGSGPISEEAYGILECDYADNISQYGLWPQERRDTVTACEGSGYIFNGQQLFTSGQYQSIMQTVDGCDSIYINLNLAVVDTVYAVEKQTTCDSLFWNGETYRASGVYEVANLSSAGCDSITALDLVIHVSKTKEEVLSACDSILWNNQLVTTSGNYNYNSTTSFGCDSFAYSTIAIHPSYLLPSSVTTCDSFLWQGAWLYDSGTYTSNLLSANGCDSTNILSLDISDRIINPISEQHCDSLVWDNDVIYDSGTYSFMYNSANGCDSIVELSLAIFQSSKVLESQSVCDSISWNGQSIKQSGNYGYTTGNALGCDSLTTLNVTVNKSYYNNMDTSVCESIMWQDSFINTSGIYTFHNLSTAGCDSTTTINIDITQLLEQEVRNEGCDSLLWDGQLIFDSGIYNKSYISSSGCDSLVNFEAIIHPSSMANIDLMDCDSVIFGANKYFQSGNFTERYKSKYGCDSIVHLSVDIGSQTSEQSIMQCDNFVWEGTNDTLFNTGIYTRKIPLSNGCDSTITLDLRINKSVANSQEISICDSYEWAINEQNYTESGIYKERYKTSEGCDSIETLELTILPSYFFSDTIFTEEAYTWPISGLTYDESGEYQVDIMTQNKCDSLYFLVLKINKSKEIFAPNILGHQEGNQLFKLYGPENMLLKKLQIFDRWGNQVYSISDIGLSTTYGWDGKFGGQKVMQGIYVWTATIEDISGTIIYKSGDITVIR